MSPKLSAAGRLMNAVLYLLNFFSVQSTNMDRTIESLRCVIAGMFGVYTFKKSGTRYLKHCSICCQEAPLPQRPQRICRA